MSRSKKHCLKRDTALRTCWRVGGLTNIVMFHGRHTHEFITHSHDDLTAILVTKGAVEIQVDKGAHRVGKGQLILIGAHQVHSAQPVDAQGWEMRSLHFPLGLLAERERTWRETGRCLSFAAPVCCNPGPAGSLFLDLHCYSQRGTRAGQQTELLGSLVNWFLKNIDTFQPQAPWHGRADIRLERARRILGGALFDNIMLEAVAAEVGLSIFSLIRRFHETYGFSPHAWRMQARANEAAKLLRQKKPLATVAGSCGFADQSHLTRVFKKVYGVTPGQYSLMH
jgi:AraC-like DNA-binding protein